MNKEEVVVVAHPTAMVSGCKCESHGQDKLHGKNQRVFNLTRKGDPKQGSYVYRCTVCSALKNTKTK